MPTSCVIGLLWGDEGKGKVIDSFAEQADYVVRYAGGHNAGHTILWRGERLVLHLIPSGVLWPDVVNVIGNGVVVDPWHLVAEVAALQGKGVPVSLGRNLLVSERAHVILPIHRELDQVAEQIRGAGRIGTTGRGIGPCYADRAARAGIRVGDLLRPELLLVRLQQLLAEKAPLLAAFGRKGPVLDTLAIELAQLGQQIAPAITDTGRLLREAAAVGRRILLEGAQGVMLDVDHGTYPYCTSSNASTAGCAVGTGLPPNALGRTTGVVKAYATRVGEGPFPTELADDLGQKLREAGREYGATTGRPRRCGWFDAVAVRYAIAASGTTEVAVTNLDVLSGFDPLRIAVAYDLPDGQRTEHLPAFDLDRVRPVFRDVPGFRADITGLRNETQLPAAARSYVQTLEQLVGVRISLVSVGPGREQVIRR